MSVTEVFDPLVGPPAQELGSIPPAPPAGVDVDDDQPVDLAEQIPTVDEGTVRSILAGIGNMASLVDRVDGAPGLWRFTDDELDQLAPPITRLANRNPTLRRALLHGDYVVIAMGLSQYAVRNVAARKEANDARRPSQGFNPARPHGGGAPFGVVDGRQPFADHVGRVVTDAPSGAQ